MSSDLKKTMTMIPSTLDPHSPCRSFTFVINNPQATDLTPILQPHPAIRYCIWQLEKGEGADTSLIRGYIELTRSERKSAIYRLFPTAWVEKRSVTREEARGYFRKPDARIDGPWEYGFWSPGPGQRTDLDILAQWFREGKTEEEIRDLNFRIWRSNIQVIRNYQALHNPKNREVSAESSITEMDSPTEKLPIARISPSHTDSPLAEQDMSQNADSNREIAVLNLKLIKNLKSTKKLLKDVSQLLASSKLSLQT